MLSNNNTYGYLKKNLVKAAQSLSHSPNIGGYNLKISKL